MAVVSSILFVLSLALGVMLGHQTRPWSWGPALIPLALAVLAGIPAIWRSRRITDPAMIWGGAAIGGWFALRAWISPVRDLAEADLLLLTGAIGSFIVMRVISGSEIALRIFLWGLAALLAATVCVMGRQLADPTFSPIFATRAGTFPSGFYSHYNEGANFLICASFLLAAATLTGRRGLFTRICWGLISLAGFVSIYFSGSRGAVLAAAAAMLLFVVALLVIGWREKAGWFVPLAIALPLLLVSATAFVLFGWSHGQQIRQQATGLSTLLDNNIRLSLMGIAVSCIELHPWAGGGSRSFSWECYRFWSVKENGWTAARPELVHNELLQSMTDYGLLGGGLLFVMLLALVIAALIRIMLKSGTRHLQADMFYVGGLAALCGMFLQSSFSFVFHLLPGAMLLGICLGWLSIPATAETPGTVTEKASKSLLTLICLLAAAFAIPYGVKSCRVFTILWRGYFTSQIVTREERLSALSEAIHIWPQTAFYKDAGLILQDTIREDMARNIPPARLADAIAMYQAGMRLHPYEGTLSVNLANMLSLADRDAEAEAEYRRAGSLQGGMELGFHAHEHATKHYLKTGRNRLVEGEFPQALEAFAAAAEEFTEAHQGAPTLRLYPEGIALNKSIQDGLGLAKEGAGDFEGALASYDALSKIETSAGNFRYGLLLSKMGYTDWYEHRSSEALGKFLKARERIAGTAMLPPNVTKDEQAKLLANLDEAIATLRAGRVEPK